MQMYAQACLCMYAYCVCVCTRILHLLPRNENVCELNYDVGPTLRYTAQPQLSPRVLYHAMCCTDQTWVKYIFVSDSNTFLRFTDLVWCIGTNEIHTAALQ
ncbi:hypothetical protein ANANG_G00292850 [Anguilla anguilla]|uniref:Uncharacterized protein n=1 Tax=Anguilla anguilla TaxID=7936 RepID=A0A9D3RM05_ANGAN|nr:hypothetical protein ANANG_G00292850 [Anguilla anguilla]